MKKEKSKKKLISCLKDLSYEQLVSVVDWSKVAKYKMLNEDPEEFYEQERRKLHIREINGYPVIVKEDEVHIQPVYGCPISVKENE